MPIATRVATFMVIAAVSVTVGASRCLAQEGAQSAILPIDQLFDPLIADPQWPHFSAATQIYMDDPEFDAVGAVSLGEGFSFYQAPAWGGRWDVGLQTAVFAAFDFNSESEDLINADYLVGIPVSWRKDQWQAMGRVFHVSSHLGDEYLLRSEVERINLSYEGIDLMVSRYFEGDRWRVYGGIGYLFDPFPETVEPWRFQGGVEFRSTQTMAAGQIRPVAAGHVRANKGGVDDPIDVSLRAGLQLDSAAGRDYQVLLLLEYFRGGNPNGQLFEQSVDYFGLGLHTYF